MTAAIFASQQPAFRGPQLGPEIVVNGNFATNSDWTDTGANWTIAAGVASVATGKGVADDFTNANTIPIVAVAQYQTSFDVVNYVGGSVEIVVGAKTGTPRSANGTFTEVLTTMDTSSPQLHALASTTLSVDNVSVKKILP